MTGAAGRALGIDLGSRRIGIAVSDPGGVLASPLRVLERCPDHRADHAALAAVVAETGAEVVVVGLPLSLNGRAGPAAEAVQLEIAELRAVLPVPVEVIDERLTTVAAGRALRTAGVRSRRQRRVVDQAAAALILQSWLDRSAAG
jgi:putative Holliday junction resolvase